MANLKGNNRPNIILLFTDQQRADTIHALGNEIIQTPNMDRLYHEGTAFVRAYTPSPVCVPGRCSMYFGLYPFSSDCTDNCDSMPQNKMSMMHVLTEQGYRTHGIGKMHFSPDFQAMCGFQTRERQEEMPDKIEDDEYLLYLKEKGYNHIYDHNGQRSEMYYIPQISQLPASDHPTQWIGDRAVEFIKNHDYEQPFFLMSSFIHPHPPFSPPTPWNKLYRTKNMPHPKVPEGFEDCITYLNKFQNRYKYRDQGIDRNLVRTQKAFYYGCISFIDYQIGRILDQLEKSGQLNNTLVILTSDHGEMLGDYNSFGKRTMLDSAANVPMLVRFPGSIEAGVRCTTPSSLVDVMPTALDAAGISYNELGLDGESLLKLQSGEVKRKYVYSQFQRADQGLYMIADERNKYIYSAADNREIFFDNKIDEMETANLINNRDLNAKLETMKENLLTVMDKHGAEYAVEAGDWRKYEALKIPSDADEGLLLQDNCFSIDRESTLPEGYTSSLNNVIAPPL